MGWRQQFSHKRLIADFAALSSERAHIQQRYECPLPTFINNECCISLGTEMEKQFWYQSMKGARKPTVSLRTGSMKELWRQLYYWLLKISVKLCSLCLLSGNDCSLWHEQDSIQWKVQGRVQGLELGLSSSWLVSVTRRIHKLFNLRHFLRLKSKHEAYTVAVV